MEHAQGPPLVPYPLCRSEQALAHRLRIYLALEGFYSPIIPTQDYVEQAREELPRLLALLDDTDACALWEALDYLFHVPRNPLVHAIHRLATR